VAMVEDRRVGWAISEVREVEARRMRWVWGEESVGFRDDVTRGAWGLVLSPHKHHVNYFWYKTRVRRSR
jgi:hypothetical protein